jgi:hypothetical protein
MADGRAAQVEQGSTARTHHAMATAGTGQVIVADADGDVAQLGLATQDNTFLVFMVTMEGDRGAGLQFKQHGPGVPAQALDANPWHQTAPLAFIKAHMDEIRTGCAAGPDTGEQALLERIGALGRQGNGETASSRPSRTSRAPVGSSGSSMCLSFMITRCSCRYVRSALHADSAAHAGHGI